MLDRSSIERFASKIDGQVITPGTPDYESSRQIFNRAFDRHPALIVRCAGATDISRSLDFAQIYNLPVAVRGGGHSRAGFSVCDNGIVIDLSPMNRVEVEERTRVARAQAGALARDMDEATQRYGLATSLGGCPTVGIAGLTLGGGEGNLQSKYGLACDNLLSAILVTVDGRQVEASQSSNPDLFWAIRGGGGNFGIATELEYRLHPVTDLLAGTLTYGNGRTAELLGAFASFVASAPDEVTLVGEVWPSHQGARFNLLFIDCGSPHDANGSLERWQALRPQGDTVRVASYLETQSTINPYVPVAHFQTDVVVPELSHSVISILTDAAGNAPPNTRMFMVPIYGAVTRVGVTETAYPWRHPGVELDIMGHWSDPADKGAVIQWVKTLRDQLQPMARGVYVNQLGETNEALVKEAYGPNYARLTTIKKAYDPKNVLRLNQNIEPL